MGLVGVLIAWKRPAEPRDLPPESLLPGIASGLRYAFLSPIIRVALIRSAAFSIGSGAIWALMPLIARDLIGGGPLVFGTLLGCFGTGAVLGALVSTRLRDALSTEGLVSAATLAFAVATVLAALSHALALTGAELLLAGGAWVLALSTFNVTVQMSSSRWVVGRAMATYQSVTFGALAIGSWLWGTLAHLVSLPVALLCAAGVLLAGLLLHFVARLPSRARLDLTPSGAWAEPKVALDFDPARVPVVVTVEYRVAPADGDGFRAAMAELRRIRQRDGARGWTLLQDIAEPECWVERFHSSSWLDHLRQHRRVTVDDLAVEQRVRAFHAGSAPPQVRHLLLRRRDR